MKRSIFIPTLRRVRLGKPGPVSGFYNDERPHQAIIASRPQSTSALIMTKPTDQINFEKRKAHFHQALFFVLILWATLLAWIT